MALMIPYSVLLSVYFNVNLSSAVFIKFKSQIIYLLFIYLFICLFIYTIFQEGDLFSSTASLPYGPSEHITDIQTNINSPLFIVHLIIRKCITLIKNTKVL